MTFYTEQTLVGLGVASLPGVVAIYLFFVAGKPKWAFALLLLSAALIRLLAISLDPFLHDWDERWHALVASNMIDNPFKPMLRADPIVPLDDRQWCCSHIWVHKQPLFMWQMALSMKLFGINTIAMRLPSAIMGVIIVVFVRDIARYWIKREDVAFMAAVLAAFAYFQIELTSGRHGLDHNDLAFTFYVTASIWAFTRYLQSPRSLKWCVIIGVFVGCAILNKWLTGLLIYGGWGLYVLHSKQRRVHFRSYAHIALSVLVACAVFVPWQLYIMHRFPLEAAWAYDFNRRHVTEVLEGHHGSVWYHLRVTGMLYGVLIPVAVVGVLLSFLRKHLDPKLSMVMLAMVFVLYFFFSVIVATKMPAFAYPVAAIVMVWMALAIVYVLDLPGTRMTRLRSMVRFAGVTVIAFIFLSPGTMALDRRADNAWRNAKIHNTRIYKSLAERYPARAILNCKGKEEIEVMFHARLVAIPWFPEAVALDSLKRVGYRFATFRLSGLPEFIAQDSGIVVIEYELW